MNARSAALALNAVTLALSAALSGVVFFWLWREYLLYGVATSAMLLMGARLLPDKPLSMHLASLGLCVGAFVGGGLGAA